MANSKQAVKRIRQSRKRREHNRRERGLMRGLIKQVQKALQEEDLEQVRRLLPRAVSRIDKTAKKGIIHRNTAGRYKGQLQKRARELEAGAG